MRTENLNQVNPNRYEIVLTLAEVEETHKERITQNGMKGALILHFLTTVQTNEEHNFYLDFIKFSGINVDNKIILEYLYFKYKVLIGQFNGNFVLFKDVRF